MKPQNWHEYSGPSSLSARTRQPARSGAEPSQRDGIRGEKLNLRFLAQLTASILLLAAAWYGIHRWQIRRHAADLLKQADAAEAQKQLDRAARFVGLYVSLVKGDTEARARYGLLLDRLAVNPRGQGAAMAVFEQVLIRDPGRQDIRRRLASVAIDVGRFDEAMQHLTILGQELPNDAEVKELTGRAYEGRGAYTKAIDPYRLAIAAAPKRSEPALRLARLFRDRLARPAEADKVLADLIAAHEQNRDDKSFQAYLQRARFLLEGTPPVEAVEAARRDVKLALQLAPVNAEVLMAAADLSARSPESRDEARSYLQQLLKRYPTNWRGYEGVANLELAAGRPRDAAQVLRRGLQKLPDQMELLWGLTNSLIQQGEIPEAEASLSRLTQLGLLVSRQNYLRGVIQLQKGDWYGARRRFEATRPLNTDSKQLTLQCDLFLAECHDHLGDLEAEVLACRRVIAVAPLHGVARLRISSALMRLGKLDEAMNECQQLTDLPAPPPAARLLLARLMIAQNLRLPAGKQRWKKIEAALDKAAGAATDFADAAILQAEVAFTRKETGKALEVLVKARAKQPQHGELWIASVDMAVRVGKAQLAQQILQEAGQNLKDGASLRLARLRLLLGSSSAVAASSLMELEGGLAQFPDEDRVKVLGALAEVHYQAQRISEARRLWDEVVRVRPNNLDARLRVFDLALQNGDEDGMRTALEGIQNLEGVSGSSGRFNEARLLIWQGQQGDKSGLPRARAELMAVSKRRPGWAPVSLCLGEVCDLEGNEELALEHYLRAIELGDRQFNLIKRVVRLLNDRRRYVDAELVIRRLPEETQLGMDLQRLVAEVSLRNGNYRNALEAARKAIQAGSKDHRDYIWLGNVLWAAAQRSDISPEQRKVAAAEADRALYQAAELGGSAADGWIAVVQHLARTDRAKVADGVIQKVKASVAPADAPLALALCYVAISRPDAAQEFLGAALKARPEDVATLRVAADFYLRVNKLTQAEQCLRKIIAQKNRERAAANWARSVLAMVLATRGGEQSLQEALAMVGRAELGVKQGSGETDIVQTRARALVLAMQPGRAQHLEAIDLIERLGGHTPLSSEDRFLLVQLYEQTGNVGKTRDRILPLLKQGGNPRYLAFHVDALLRQKSVVEAEQWLGDLEKLEPHLLRTTYLKARVLKIQGKEIEAGRLLKPYAQGQDAETILRVAAMLEEVGCPAEAEPLYRSFVATSKDPERVLVLARFLARQVQSRNEAVDLCDKAWQTCRPQAAAEASLAVLQTAHANESQLERLGHRFKEAISKHPGLVALVACLANLEELRGRFREAQELYRQALKRDPRGALAANNLAYLLALQDGKGAEALEQVNLAAEVLGPLPEILDTRAVAYIAASRPAEALKDLQDALSRTNLNPKVRFSMTFHLAWAHQRSGNRVAAKKFWDKAHSEGCGLEDLHRLDQPEYRKLAAEFGR